jgi:hypothetical protein
MITGVERLHRIVEGSPTCGDCGQIIPRMPSHCPGKVPNAASSITVKVGLAGWLGVITDGLIELSRKAIDAGMPGDIAVEVFGKAMENAAVRSIEISRRKC